jgi:hypothetical protein
MRWRGLARPSLHSLPVSQPLPIAQLPILRLLIAQLPFSRLPLPRSHPVARVQPVYSAALVRPTALCCSATTGCQNPAVGAGLPALPAFPEFPPGRSPSSVVRDFYCETSALHKSFPRYIQDSLVIHKTSGVYPPCTVDFHRRMHKLSTTSVDTAAMRVKARRIAAADHAGLRSRDPCLPAVRCREHSVRQGSAQRESPR